MSDNPYPNASNTMNYELHTAWDEGYAEGFAAGRAALPDPPEAFLCPDCGHIGDAVSRIDRACVNHPPGERRPMVRLRSRADAERLAAALPDERLREALTRANDDLIQIADYSPSEVADAIDSVRAAIKDALAADREENTDA